MERLFLTKDSYTLYFQQLLFYWQALKRGAPLSPITVHPSLNTFKSYWVKAEDCVYTVINIFVYLYCRWCPVVQYSKDQELSINIQPCNYSLIPGWGFSSGVYTHAALTGLWEYLGHKMENKSIAVRHRQKQIQQRKGSVFNFLFPPCLWEPSMSPLQWDERLAYYSEKITDWDNVFIRQLIHLHLKPWFWVTLVVCKHPYGLYMFVLC